MTFRNIHDIFINDVSYKEGKELKVVIHKQRVGKGVFFLQYGDLNDKKMFTYSESYGLIESPQKESSVV